MLRNMVVCTITFACCTIFADSSTSKGDTLSCVKLEGFHNARHAQWCVGSCAGNNRAVIFYSVPGDRKIVENAADCINDKKDNVSGPTIYYVVNKKRVALPAMMVRTMLKERSKKYPDITYCIDHEEQLPAAWKLAPKNASIVVLDKNGIVLFGGILPLKQHECENLKEILITEP